MIRTFLFIIMCMFCLSCKKYDVDTNGIPKFVKVDFIELGKITRISKFRSGSGHNYTDDFETCRSMKHYFSMDTSIEPQNILITNVYSPISGKIIRLQNENNTDTKQIWIKSEEYPAFVFRIFHVNCNKTIKFGTHVSPGTILGSTTNTDIAVIVRTTNGKKLISYFDVMSDTLFANYIVRGVSNRNDLIISKEERDFNPIECEGDKQFPNQFNTFNSDWFFLN